MSGTAFGTIVLHITPEIGRRRPAGGNRPRRGDPRLMLDVEARVIELLIDTAELQRRLAAWKVSPPQRHIPHRGYARLFEECVLQADQGCDFDFLLRTGDSKAEEQ